MSLLQGACIAKTAHLLANLSLHMQIQPLPRMATHFSGYCTRPVQVGTIEGSADRAYSMCLPREYWMICRGPGFLAVVWFGSFPPPPSPVSKLDRRHIQEDWERETTCWGRGGGGKAIGAKSYDGEKAWSSINQSILSVFAVCHFMVMCRKVSRVQIFHVQ